MTEKAQAYYSLADKVGSVKVDEEEFQLCDHVQKIEGVYYATTFTKNYKTDGRDDNTGIFYKRISNADLAFLPLEKLQKAEPMFDDHNQTNEMKDRLVTAISNMNSTKFKEVI